MAKKFCSNCRKIKEISTEIPALGTVVPFCDDCKDSPKANFFRNLQVGKPDETATLQRVLWILSSRGRKQ